MNEVKELKDWIIGQDKTCYFSITGGGTESISSLLKHGGASKVFIGATVPYAESELDDLVQHRERQIKCCSEDVAIMLCLNHEASYSVGVTASLYSVNQRQGRINRAYLSIFDRIGRQPYTNSIEFNVNGLENCDKWAREYQENLLSQFILLNLIYCMYNGRIPLTWLFDNEEGYAEDLLEENITISNSDFKNALNKVYSEYYEAQIA